MPSSFPRRVANALRLAFASALLALAGLNTGCATTGTATVAPRSSVSREHALALAQLTANAVGGQVFTVAPTGSMKPTLDDSSVVTVEKVPSLRAAPRRHRHLSQRQWFACDSSPV
ncbi:MAG: hypothetical protein QM760_02285 [Nibricoccus sp.]